MVELLSITIAARAAGATTTSAAKAAPVRANMIIFISIYYGQNSHN